MTRFSCCRSLSPLLTGILLAITTLAGCRTVPLRMPPPIAFQAQSRTTVEAAILNGCHRLRWLPSKIREGTIRATLTLRSHYAVVDIDYTTDSFTVRYVESDELRYRKSADGRETIHKNFNSWVQNLVVEIDRQLEKQRDSAASTKS